MLNGSAEPMDMYMHGYTETTYLPESGNLLQNMPIGP